MGRRLVSPRQASDWKSPQPPPDLGAFACELTPLVGRGDWELGPKFPMYS